MKKLSILLFAFVAFTGLNSCSSDDDVVFIAQPDTEGISFTNSFNQTYVLTSATGTNVAERFVWGTVDFDVPTNITYEVQGSAYADFSSFDVLGTTGSNNFAVTVNQMRALAEDAGLDNDPSTDAPNTGQIYFRVQAYAGSGGGTSLGETSEIISLTVVLPEGEGEVEPPLPNFFLVGDATAAGWNPNNNNTPLFRDGTNPAIFHFTGRFAGGSGVEGFKLLEVLGNWQPQWGIRNGALTNSTILGEDPSAFPVAADAYYTFTMDVDAMTYTFTPYDAGAAPTYDALGIVGDATPGGWDVDTPLTKSSFDPHIWYAKNVEFKAGKWKLRANGNWDVNWGGPTPISGLGSLNGADIESGEGTYDVWFNDITGRYLLVPVE